MTNTRTLLTRIALVAGSVVALAGFTWPLVAQAVPADAQAATPVLAFALVPALIAVLALTLDREMHSAKAVALLGVLAAIGAAIRIASAGVGGIEAVFILLILAGRAYGARFGFLLGLLTIAFSSLLWGGIGPWTPFQMFACAWVAAGAGLLPRMRPRPASATPPLGAGTLDPAALTITSTAVVKSIKRAARLEIVMLAVYGVVASYVFGLLMNIWFWPFAVGTGTGISYDAEAPIGTNLASFTLYSLVSSTLTWDSVRAVTTVVGVVLLGPAVLAALRRAKLPGRSSGSHSPVG